MSWKERLDTAFVNENAYRKEPSHNMITIARKYDRLASWWLESSGWLIVRNIGEKRRVSASLCRISTRDLKIADSAFAYLNPLRTSNIIFHACLPLFLDQYHYNLLSEAPLLPCFVLPDKSSAASMHSCRDIGFIQPASIQRRPS